MHLKLEHRKLRNETYLFKHESNQLLNINYLLRN
jgi:hypothetical protein